MTSMRLLLFYSCSDLCPFLFRGIRLHAFLSIMSCLGPSYSGFCCHRASKKREKSATTLSFMHAKARRLSERVKAVDLFPKLYFLLGEKCLLILFLV